MAPGVAPAPITLDLSAAALLAVLHRGGAAGYYWRPKGAGSTWFGAGAPPAPPAYEDVYFGVHPATAMGRPGQRSTTATVAALACLYAEFDAKDFTGGKAESLSHVEALAPPPSAVVDSGGGYHCYWLLSEPWLIHNEDERQRARELQARWVEVVGGDRASRDLVRMLRVPGTLNSKYHPPRPVILLRLDLDAHYDLDALERHVRARLPPLPPPPIMPAQVGSLAPANNSGSVKELIAAFNHEHPAEQLLAAYGATRTRAGWACTCGVNHSHETQIGVLSGGRLVFFSPRCAWAPARTDRNGRPIADSFDLFTIVEHGGDKAAALRALRTAGSTRPNNFPSAPVDRDRRETDAAQAEARRRDALQKRETRRHEAATTLQAVRDRAAKDGTLTPCERAVLLALLDVAGERDWCRPSKARLCAMSSYALGSVKRALMRLEARDYFSSQGDGGRSTDTAIRTFLRGSSPPPDAPQFLRGSSTDDVSGCSYVDHAASLMIPESVGIQEQDIYSKASEAGASSHTGSPAAALVAPSAAYEVDEWAALLANRDAAPPLLDPAARAAWDVQDGLCDISPAGRPEVQQAAAEEESAIAADEARILAYRATWREMPPPASRELPPEEDETVAFPGGASFDPNASCVEPFDLDAHWVQRTRTDASRVPDLVAQPVAPLVVFVSRAQIDPDHRRRISELTSKAQFCRHKARVATSRAQRRWARREVERLSYQVQALKAEQVAVSAEYARRTARCATEASADTGHPPVLASPAFSVVQNTLFSYVHETPIGGGSEEWKRRGGS